MGKQHSRMSLFLFENPFRSMPQDCDNLLYKSDKVIALHKPYLRWWHFVQRFYIMLKCIAKMSAMLARLSPV
ncbi:hypothetical protein EP13_04215 [Alteromonas australica]|uniref:Uncharacterized protein n=1 Tax=Alteromonas australica TaxID=589873 RepID=A0A075NWW3_9ALTE|nr:hypothetical protein EP13_04215 [Alteromonas australica]